MVNVDPFEHVSACLEAATSLNRTQARGTLRLALKDAGLEAASVRPEQLAVVLRKRMPEELRMCGIQAAEAICERLADQIQSLEFVSDRSDRPEDVFARLGES